ncbi:MAG: hypothetical protein ABIQ73_14300 [Acidimicrobiales bacterium]
MSREGVIRTVRSARQVDEAVARFGESNDDIADYPFKRRAGVLPHSARCGLEDRVAAPSPEANVTAIGERFSRCTLRRSALGGQ